MYLLLLFLITSLNLNFSDSNYVVMYKQEIYKVGKDVRIPKVAVPDEYKQAIGKDSIAMTEIIHLPFVISIEMRVNTKGDYTLKEQSLTPGISLGNNRIQYFKDGKFFYDNDPNTEKALPITFKKTKGSKNILGFKCERFIATNRSTKVKYEIWATKRLPQTITGFYRWPQFGYAVLEITDLKGFWKCTATSVKSIKKDIDVFKDDL